MNEAVIFQSPHAIKPEVFLTEAEREERYRTRLDETFCPYTVLDVLTRVYRHRPEDDLCAALARIQAHLHRWKREAPYQGRG